MNPTNKRPISATGTSADGSVVVGYSVSAAGTEAFVWDEVNGMRSIKDLLIAAGIDLTGWQLIAASGVSYDGTVVVGGGYNPAGDQEGWIATLPDSTSEPTPVQIDVNPNRIHIDDHGILNVAVFTTDDFDAADIDVSTVVFAGANVHHSELTDVDGDGDQDMVLYFREADTNLREMYEQLLYEDILDDGSYSGVQNLEAAITGETVGGELFEGTDELDLFLAGRWLDDLVDELFP